MRKAALVLVLAFMDIYTLHAAEDARWKMEFNGVSMVQDNHPASMADTGSILFHQLALRGINDVQWTPELYTEIHLLGQANFGEINSMSHFGPFSQTGATPLFLVDHFDIQGQDNNGREQIFYPDRFNLTWASDKMNVRIGRQAVSFGKTFLWNPIDWISPFTPSTADRRYKPGADIIRVDAWATEFSGTSFLYAFGPHDRQDTSAALLRYIRATEYLDIEGIAGRVKQETRIGYGIATTAPFLQGGALRSEGAYIWPDNRVEGSFVRATLGYDYRFSNPLGIVTEYHYNGLGATDPTGYGNVLMDPHILSGEITQIGAHYGGLITTYDITPLLTMDAGGMVNFNDRSYALTSGLNYSLSDEAALRGYLFLPEGKLPAEGQPVSEFGLYPTFITLSFTMAF